MSIEGGGIAQSPRESEQECGSDLKEPVPETSVNDVEFDRVVRHWFTENSWPRKPEEIGRLRARNYFYPLVHHYGLLRVIGRKTTIWRIKRAEKLLSMGANIQDGLPSPEVRFCLYILETANFHVDVRMKETNKLLVKFCASSPTPLDPAKFLARMYELGIFLRSEPYVDFDKAGELCRSEGWTYFVTKRNQAKMVATFPTDLNMKKARVVSLLDSFFQSWRDDPQHPPKEANDLLKRAKALKIGAQTSRALYHHLLVLRKVGTDNIYFNEERFHEILRLKTILDWLPQSGETRFCRYVLEVHFHTNRPVTEQDKFVRRFCSSSPTPILEADLVKNLYRMGILLQVAPFLDLNKAERICKAENVSYRRLRLVFRAGTNTINNNTSSSNKQQQQPKQNQNQRRKPTNIDQNNASLAGNIASPFQQQHLPIHQPEYPSTPKDNLDDELQHMEAFVSSLVASEPSSDPLSTPYISPYISAFDPFSNHHPSPLQLNMPYSSPAHSNSPDGDHSANAQQQLKDHLSWGAAKSSPSSSSSSSSSSHEPLPKFSTD